MKKWMSLFIALMLCGCANQPAKSIEKEEVKLIVATDLHYFSPENFQDCPWFESALSEGDGKMSHLSQEIIDGFVEEVLEEKPDYVLLTGDLTFNGEKNSHMDLEQSLAPIRDAGIRIVVIDGNHDIKNIMARKYTNDGYETVEDINEETFKKIYKNDGYHLAVSEDEHSLSYRVDLNPKYSLILLDTINKSYFADQGSFISEETMTWLENELKSITEAGKIPLVAMHHNLAIHHEMLYAGYVTDHQETIINMFHQYQVPLVLSGHSHVQDIEYINGIYDVCTTSLAVSPIQYGIVTLTDTQIEYKTDVVDVIEGDEAFFVNASIQRYSNRYADVFDEEISQEAIAFLSEVNRCFFAGELNEHAERLINDPIYQLLITQDENIGGMAFSMLKNLDTITSQKELHIDLKP